MSPYVRNWSLLVDKTADIAEKRKLGLRTSNDSTTAYRLERIVKENKDLRDFVRRYTVRRIGRRKTYRIIFSDGLQSFTGKECANLTSTMRLDTRNHRIAHGVYIPKGRNISIYDAPQWVIQEDLAWTDDEKTTTETNVEKNGAETISVPEGDKTNEVRSPNYRRWNLANLIQIV